MEDQEKQNKVKFGYRITTGPSTHSPIWKYGCVFAFVKCLKEHHTKLFYFISITLLSEWS